MSEDAEGEAYFLDADELEVPGGEVTDAGLATLVRSLVRAHLASDDPGEVKRAIAASFSKARDRFAFAWNAAMADVELAGWIDASSARKERALEVALTLSPPDPSPVHNAAAFGLAQRFDAWSRYDYAVIVVPGYTPLDATTASSGVHPVARRRLEQAASDFAQALAPFILVSGANVYPRGTPYYEALEMKAELLQMGIQEERVIVDARARHSTTNLRNAGRIMLEHGMREGLIATEGGGVLGSDLFGQDFYFANPEMSTFYSRCERELGYRVGELSEAAGGRTKFVPSPSVRLRNYREALDP